MNLGEFAIRKKTITLVMTLVLLFGGALAFLDMPRLEDPNFTIKEALIITSYPGATADEVANEVTDVIESAVQQLGQLDKVTSTNYRGRSIVRVEMKDSYDANTLPQVWDELRRKVGEAAAALPPGASTPFVMDDFGDVYGILLSVTGEGYSQRDLQDYVDYLRKQLLLVNNVAKVTVWGKQTESVYVEISRARMAQIGISLQAVYETLSKRNLVVDAGNVRVGSDYIEISPTGGIKSVEALGDLLIKSGQGGHLVPLKDIATIKKGYIEPATEIMRHDGKTSIALGISMVPTGNVVDLGKAIRAKLADLESKTPVGMVIEPVYFQPKRVEMAIDSFMINLAEAVAIVIVVLVLFMGWQSGLLIGTVLLITISGSFIFISMWGVALERISLGALIIALGMLVDNAIVVVEGMLVRYQQGMDRLKAAGEVVAASKWPLLGATIVAIMAFAGIGLSPDAVGEFCRSLFIVLCVSLFMSWITAVTITPLLCDMFLKPKQLEDSDPYKGFLFVIYKKLLTFCLRNKTVTLALLVVMLVASIMGFGYVKQSFFPDSTLPRFYIHYWLPQGSDIRTASDDLKLMEKLLLEDKRVASVSTFVGKGAPRFMLTYSPENTNPSYALALVKAKDYLEIPAIIAKYKTILRKSFPDAKPMFKMVKLGPGSAASIEARFSGPDTKVLKRLAEEAKTIMRASGNAEYIRDDWRQSVKILKPVMAEAQAKRAGITRPDLARAIKLTFVGERVGVYREDNKLLPIIARPPRAERGKVDDIRNVQVFSPTAGKMIPIGEVVSNFDTRFEFGMLKTRNRLLTITAQCDPIEGLPSVLFNQIRPAIEAIKLPTGYTLEWGGEYEDSSDAQGNLAANLPLPFSIMILVTILLFNRLRIPLIIWLTVPLAIIGVSTGLLVTGQPFGFMALLGFLSLSGMLIKNSIVLLDQVNIELADGKAPYNAVVDASVSRIRPVAMAAATTILGMIPLVADAFFASMAVTIISGLAFATILTLLVVPVLYALFHKVRNP